MAKTVRQKNDERARKRRALVLRLAFREYSRTSIMEGLRKDGYEVSDRTMDRDLAAIRKDLAKKVEQGTGSLQEILMDFTAKYSDIFRDLWHTASTTKNERVKVQCLGTLARMLNDKVAVLQSLGIVRQAPQQVEVTGGFDVRQMVAIVKKEYRLIEEEKA